jgi:hypothetical protein
MQQERKEHQKNEDVYNIPLKNFWREVWIGDNEEYEEPDLKHPEWQKNVANYFTDGHDPKEFIK